MPDLEEIEIGSPSNKVSFGSSDTMDTEVSTCTEGNSSSNGNSGKSRHIPLKREESRQMADMMAADVISKPFSFVGGQVSQKSFNPFRKKSGLLNVLAQQASKKRIVFKDGRFNVSSSADGKQHRLLKDFFISILEMSWLLICSIFAAAFFLSWLLFAVVWYLTFLQHGDFDEEPVNPPCVDNIKDFASCFLFSVETQHTIGYGGRYVYIVAP